MIKSPVAPHVKGAMGLRSDKCVIHCHFEETGLGFVTWHATLLELAIRSCLEFPVKYLYKRLEQKEVNIFLFKMLKTQYSGHVYWRYKLTYLVDDFTFLKCICNVM